MSVLGFNNVLIRFLPAATRKNVYLSTAFSVTTIASIVASAFFLLWAFLTKNNLVETYYHSAFVLLFFGFVLISTLNSLLDSAFIAYRSTVYIFAKSTLISFLKIILLFLLVDVGFGIISSVTLATGIALVFGFLFLIFRFAYKPSLAIDIQTIKETGRFAAGNYIGSVFAILPLTFVPLILLSKLGSQDAAFFYMPLMIIALLNVIPSASAQSLFAETSANEYELAKNVRNALKQLLLLLIPSAIVLLVLGGFVLSFFGTAYAAHGTLPLQILTMGSLVGALNYFGDTLLNIKKLSRLYVFMNALNAIAIVIPAYVVASYGLSAVACSYLFGQVVTLIVYLSLNWELLRSQVIAAK